MAADLGVRGAVFAIAEPDVLLSIHDQLAAAQSDGRVDRLNERMVASARSAFMSPPPVAGMKPAEIYAKRLINPAIVIEKDIKTPEGHVLARRGQMVNPLDHRPMRQTLLFVDGREKAQMDWALAHKAPEKGQKKIILIAGAPAPLMKQHKTRLYFDQKGALTRHFGLKRTPSRIKQSGRFLQLEEIPVNDGEGQ